MTRVSQSQWLKEWIESTDSDPPTKSTDLSDETFYCSESHKKGKLSEKKKILFWQLLKSTLHCCRKVNDCAWVCKLSVNFKSWDLAITFKSFPIIIKISSRRIIPNLFILFNPWSPFFLLILLNKNYKLLLVTSLMVTESILVSCIELVFLFRPVKREVILVSFVSIFCLLCFQVLWLMENLIFKCSTISIKVVKIIINV